MWTGDGASLRLRSFRAQADAVWGASQRVGQVGGRVRGRSTGWASLFFPSLKAPLWESGREDRLSPGAWRREWPQSASRSRVARRSPGLQPHRSREAVEVCFPLLSRWLCTTAELNTWTRTELQGHNRLCQSEQGHVN